MKKNQIILLFFAALFALPVIATSQKLAQNYTLRQKSAFIENKGQVADQNGIERKDVKYLYSAPGLKLVLKNNSFSYEVFTLEKKRKQEAVFSEATGLVPASFLPDKFKEPEQVTVKTHRVDISFVGANPDPEIIAEEKSSDYNIYYLSHTTEEGVREAYSYSKLTYRNLYPNIDIVFYAKEEGKLKYDIVVHPGGKIKNVKMSYSGAAGLEMVLGKLKLTTALGIISEEIPYSFLQENKQEVKVRHVLNNGLINFNCIYDNTRTLVIDPTLIWGTYYGGSDYDVNRSITEDGNGNTYITGNTNSTSEIATTGAHQSIFEGNGDAFIVKFNSSGVRQWGTYYGGSDFDAGNSINTDSSSNIYVTGTTKSTSGIATIGAHQTSLVGLQEAFVVKFNNSGLRQWGTYYGGSGNDYGNSIITDNIGNIFVTGNTMSSSGIATMGTHQTSIGVDNNDGFVVKFNSSGVRQWGTYYGGSGLDVGLGISRDVSGNVYVAGFTESTSGITTSGAHQAIHGGYKDAFVVKFNSNGLRQWGTYYGGDFDDYCYSIITDRDDNVYITGSAGSSYGIATLGAHQTSRSGPNDAFIAKFNSSGLRNWGTYYGGDNSDAGNSISIDKDGNIYIIGYTSSTTGVATLGSFQTSFQGINDAFIAKFNSSGLRHWGTYYGGSDFDIGNSICTDRKGNIYVTGYSKSTSGIVTIPAHQTSFGGGAYDGFIAKIESCESIGAIKGDTVTCAGNLQRFTISKGTGLTYKWSVTIGTIISGQGTDSIVVNWTSAGTGSIKVVVASSNCKDSTTKNITINPLPVAKLTITKDSTAKRTYNFSSNTTVSQYYWSFGDGKIDSSKTVKHTYQKDSIYKINLVLKDTNGCTDITDTTINVKTVGINEINTPVFDIKVYPNPFSNSTTLEYELQKRSNVDISIYDLAGKEIAALQKGTQQNGKHILNIDAEKYQLKAGVYLLKVVAGNQIISRQLVKLK